MCPQKYSWLTSVSKAIRVFLYVITPSVIDALIPWLDTNVWGWPLIVVAILIAALRALSNYLKNKDK